MTSGRSRNPQMEGSASHVDGDDADTDDPNRDPDDSIKDRVS